VPLLAALVAAGLLSAVQVPGGRGAAQVEAGSATLDVATGTYRLAGGVIITRGAVRLRATAARWDPATDEVTATGGVLLTDATRAVAAESIKARIGSDYQASEVLAWVKKPGAPLETAATPTAAAACGQNVLTASAHQASGQADGTLHLTGARMTPCDCPGAGAPSWELRTDQATVIPGERVELSWPVLWITPRFLFVDRPVPVLALPWLSLPLGDRVSGLLMPTFGSTGPTGVTLALPWFQTLGRSADLTITPRYAFGPSASQAATGGASVRGPGADLELRWAPAVDAAGRLEVDGLWNLSQGAGSANVAHGLRLAVRGVQDQRFGTDTRLRAELDLVGDPLYVRDFTIDSFSKTATSRRSALLVSNRTGDTAVELSAAYLEPVDPTGALAAIDGGLFGARVPAFHRWPALSATLTPIDLDAGLLVSGRLGLSRWAPTHGATSDGGVNGLGPGDRGWVQVPPDQNPGQQDGRWEPGERLAASRLDGRVELRETRRLGPVVAEAFARGAALGYLLDGPHDPVANAWLAGGFELSTALARRYGDLRHELVPRAEWRLGSAVAGGALPAYGYDAWDRAPSRPPGDLAAPEQLVERRAAAAPPGAFSQLRLSLTSHLVDPKGELFFAELGQELDQKAGRLAEAYLVTRATRGLVSGEADVRVWTGGRPAGAPASLSRSWLDAFSLLRGRVGLADGRGDGLALGLLSVDSGGSGRLGGGVDAFFDPRSVELPAQAWGTAGATAKLGPATISYEAHIAARPQLGGCLGTRQVGSWEIQQHAATVEWDSPCHCFRARATFTIDACGILGYGLIVDLGQAANTPR
jgi:LPS-assembly protein